MAPRRNVSVKPVRSSPANAWVRGGALVHAVRLLSPAHHRQCSANVCVQHCQVLPCGLVYLLSWSQQASSSLHAQTTQRISLLSPALPDSTHTHACLYRPHASILVSVAFTHNLRSPRPSGLHCPFLVHPPLVDRERHPYRTPARPAAFMHVRNS